MNRFRNESPRPWARRAWAIGVVSLLCVLRGSAVWAGPPLVADDPNTVGRGRVEAILTATFAEQADERVASAPLLDLTVGLVPGLDAVVVATSQLEFQTADGVNESEFVAVGFKWEPLRRDDWRVAWTPQVLVDGSAQARTSVYLPVQVESSLGTLTLGSDLGFIARIDGRDAFQVAGYVGWRATRDFNAPIEVWSRGTSNGDVGDLGTSAGFEWILSPSFDLLASGGTGIDSWGGSRVEWTAYLGVRWKFGLPYEVPSK